LLLALRKGRAAVQQSITPLWRLAGQNEFSSGIEGPVVKTTRGYAPVVRPARRLHLQAHCLSFRDPSMASRPGDRCAGSSRERQSKGVCRHTSHLEILMLSRIRSRPLSWARSDPATWMDALRCPTIPTYTAARLSTIGLPCHALHAEWAGHAKQCQSLRRGSRSPCCPVEESLANEPVVVGRTRTQPWSTRRGAGRGKFFNGFHRRERMLSSHCTLSIRLPNL